MGLQRGLHAYEQLVLNNYEVDPSYFEEKYNMPVGERRQQAPVLAPTEPNSGGEEPKDDKTPKPDKKKRQEQNKHPFFD